MDSDERITKSKKQLRKHIIRELARVAHQLPLPSAPQSDLSDAVFPPPHYTARDPMIHPTGTDYDVRVDPTHHRRHNNGAPSLPVYTPVVGLGETVLQFGGDEAEQRRALVRWLKVECCREEEEVEEEWLSRSRVFMASGRRL